MFKLIKYELLNNVYLIIAIAMLSLISILLTQFISPYVGPESINSRIIFPLMAGILPVIVIAKSWLLRMKEYRDMLIIPLPVSLNKTATSRFLIPVIMFIYTFFVVSLSTLMLPVGWEGIKVRILLQVSTIFTIVANLLLAYDFSLIVEHENIIVKVFAGTVLFSFVMSVFFVIDKIVGESNLVLCASLSLFGIFLLFIDSLVFKKRLSFLV